MPHPVPKQRRNGLGLVLAVFLATLLLWILVPVQPVFSQQATGRYPAPEPLSLESASGPHIRFDMYLHHSSSAQGARWHVIQGPGIVTVYHPDDEPDIARAFGFSGPALGEPRWLDRSKGLLVAQNHQAPDSLVGQIIEESFSSRKVFVDDVQIILERSSDDYTIEGLTLEHYRLHIEIRKQPALSDGAHPASSVFDVITGDVWLIPELSFTDAIFLPYHHPFALLDLPVNAYLQRDLAERFAAIGALGDSRLRIFENLSPEQLAQVQQGELPQTAWPLEVRYRMENVDQSPEPDYEAILGGARLVDLHTFARLTAGETIFNLIDGCYPPPPWIDISDYINLTGNIAGHLAGEVEGMAFFGSNSEPGREGFMVEGLILTDDPTMFVCLGLLRIGAADPEPGEYRILPAEPQDAYLSDRAGQFTGYVNLIYFDGDVFEILATFETEEGWFRVIDIDGDVMLGSLEFSALGLTRGDFLPTDLTLAIDFEAWWDLPIVPYVR